VSALFLDLRFVLGRHVECVDDCNEAIRKNSLNLKAYFRGAKASYSIGLFDQARTFCLKGRTACPEDCEALESILVLSESQLSKLASARHIEQSESSKRNQTKKMALESLLRQRGIELRKEVPYDIGFLSNQADPVVDDEGAIHWPAILLYDEFGISEYICDFHEGSTLEAQLEVVLPTDRRPDWDARGSYTFKSVDVFFEPGGTVEQVYHVPLDVPLGDIIGAFKCVSKVAIFHILEKNSAALARFEEANDVAQINL